MYVHRGCRDDADYDSVANGCGILVSEKAGAERSILLPFWI